MRFKGFEGEWEKKKLEEFIDIISGIALQSEDISENELGIPILRGINITEGFIRHSREIDRYYPKNLTDKIKKYLLQKGDIVIGMDGSKVGKNVALVSESDEGSILIQRVARIKALENAEISYIYQKIFSSEFHQYVDIVNTSSGIPHISLQQIKDFEIGFPATIIEQQKIASFLSLIDERIATQSKIIQRLETLIKGLCQKIFNQKKEDFKCVPLGSICVISKGEQINSSELSKVDKYYVMNGGVLPSGYHFEYNTEADIISISEGGNSCGYVQYNETRFWSGGHCYTLNDVNINVKNKYLYYYLKAFENDIMKLRVGSGLPNIQKKSLDGFQVLVPTIEKQEEIIAILDNLSNKLKIENRISSNYQCVKKHLLQNLFI